MREVELAIHSTQQDEDTNGSVKSCSYRDLIFSVDTTEAQKVWLL
jgi:hypothetical protein